jgi:hypothetical protein
LGGGIVMRLKYGEGFGRVMFLSAGL